MCSRFYVDEESFREIEKLIRETSAGLIRQRHRDIHPSEDAVILTGKRGKLTAQEMKWGFPQYGRTGLLINARAETVLERKTFRESVLHRRCVIPARWFYEWDAAKEKVTFRRKEEPVLYMAGFYNCFSNAPGQDRFIILTTQANGSVASVHERMPLILEENELEEWIYEDGLLEALLQKKPCLLESYREYEQQSLF